MSSETEMLIVLSISMENFNEELGRKIALKNAQDKVWALEGYALRERLRYDG